MCARNHRRFGCGHTKTTIRYCPLARWANGPVSLPASERGQHRQVCDAVRQSGRFLAENTGPAVDWCCSRRCCTNALWQLRAQRDAEINAVTERGRREGREMWSDMGLRREMGEVYHRYREGKRWHEIECRSHDDDLYGR